MLRINNHFSDQIPKSHKFSQFLTICTHTFFIISSNFFTLCAISWLNLHLQVFLEFCWTRLRRKSCKFIHCAKLELQWQLNNSSTSCVSELNNHHYSLSTSIYSICFHSLEPNSHDFHSCTSRRLEFKLFNSRNCHVV